MGRHPFDVVAFVAGVAFVVIGVLGLVDAAGGANPVGPWVLPVTLLALGIGGLAGAVARSRRGR